MDVLRAQGSAADIAKLAMIRTTSELQEVAARSGHPAGRLLLQIHDELLMEVPEPDVLVAARAIRDAMAGAVHFDGVPLAVKIQSGRSWGELQLLELQP